MGHLCALDTVLIYASLFKFSCCSSYVVAVVSYLLRVAMFSLL